MEQNKELSFEELFNESLTDDVKVHDIVKGEVISINGKTAKVNLNTYTEGTIYLDHFTTDDVESFDGLLKVGDVVEAEVTKISENKYGESEILLSRLNMAKKENYDSFKEETPVDSYTDAKVVRVLNNGYVLSNGKISMFLPKKDIREELQQGETVKVKILSYNDDKLNAFVSRYQVVREQRQKEHEEYVARKQAEHEEYEKAKALELATFNVGDTVKGKVVSIVPYGAFVQFDKVRGLIRLKDVAHQYLKSAADVLKVDDEVECKVLSIANGKLELSRKALIKTPVQTYLEKHNVGDTVKGTVKSKLPFGILVNLDEDVTGLLHKSEFSWNPNDNLAASLTIGEEIEVAILSVDEENQKISLSKKVLMDNPWSRVEAKDGDVDDCVVKEVKEAGLEVDTLGVEAFLPQSQTLLEKNQKIDQVYSVGEKLVAQITEFEPKRWKMTVSEKAYKAAQERAEFEKYNEQNEEVSTSLGDLYKDELTK